MQALADKDDMNEERHVYFDEDLRIEAYSLHNIMQAFPNHFHSFYVIGYIESGWRHVVCKGCDYDLGSGSLVIFNPQDNHQCSPINNMPLYYRAINIDRKIMEQFAYETTGKGLHPYFSQNVIFDSDIVLSLARLYDLIVEKAPRLEKEEAFCFLLEQLILQFCDETVQEPSEEREDFLELQEYFAQHYSENISLEQLANMYGFSKSYLVRSFTRKMGISPYRYLQNVRIEKAKKLLQDGNQSVSIALDCGFSDQSHFANTFKRFIGLTPSQYGQIFHRRS